jgi:putrescine transport system ATP-binding protein
VRLDNGFVIQAAAANLTRTRPIDWHDRVFITFAPDAGVLLTR